MKKLILFCLLITGGMLRAQQPIDMLLYPDGAPDSNGITDPEVWNDDRTAVKMVSTPRILVYLPEKQKATGRAVVICPGGGYGGLAMDREGYFVADWLNARGIAAIILKYRMPNGNNNIPLEDFHQAISTVRTKAVEWGINPAKVGVMGFSAGGHLASTATVYFDKATRPDFSILIYPVISLEDGLAHTGSRDRLIGVQEEDKSRFHHDVLIERYSTYKHVTEACPTVFLALSNDDKVVPPVNSVLFYKALNEKGVSAEMHIYPKGGHGWGFRSNFAYRNEFLTSLGRWMDALP